MTKIILGGGLSGLSATYYLSKSAPQQKVALIEASNRLGGWIKSNKQESGVIFEEGPRTIRPIGDSGTNTLNLIEELGLGNEIVPLTMDSPAAKNRMIYVNGHLYSLPNSFWSLFKAQKPFSKSIVLSLLQDFKTKPKLVEDDSIYDFTKRRFGAEVADYLISPMICGICAGNSKEVSVNFLMKQLFQYEQKYGSITSGIVKHALDKKTAPMLGKLALKAKIEKWSVYSFRDGIETLPRVLEDAITTKFSNVNIQTNVKCNNIEFTDKNAIVHFENGTTHTSSHVVSSLPAQYLAPLIEQQHPDLATMLTKIKMVTVGVVNLHFKGNLIKNPGFGFLVPPKENLPILGVIFDSCCFSTNSDTILTVMMGGYWFQERFGLNPSTDFLLQTALEQIKSILGISASPVEYKVNILKNCIPQYVVGHNRNLQNIELYIGKNKLGLSLCGSSYYGVGVNDVILSAKNVVEKMNKL